MRKLSHFIGSSVLLLLIGLPACQGGSDTTGPQPEVEKLADIKPNLPAVPTLPPPPHPVQYDDRSYSIYGARKRIKQTMDTELAVTGYVVDVYVPNPCPKAKLKAKECPQPLAPHFWIADTTTEKDHAKCMTVVGYAERHKELHKGGHDAPHFSDFSIGNRLRISGQFSRSSGLGFSESEGLIDYKSHQKL